MDNLLDLGFSPLDPEAPVFAPSDNSLIHYPQDQPCLSPAPHELGIVSPLPEAYVSHQGTPSMSPDWIVPSSASSESDEELTESSNPPCELSNADFERLDATAAKIDDMNAMIIKIMNTVK